MNTLSISELAPRLREGAITSRDLVEECLTRIEKFEPDVKAWALVDADGARCAADDAGRRIAAGDYRGPLDGVPVGIKDIIDVAGMPTKAGSPTRASQPAAVVDAPLVAALRRAGAIILGKTVTVEFACFDPSPTRNPWNVKHTPGGSSSGSAAALALGMCYGSIGTQTGGSLVRPSSYCGTATLKPTFGRLSREGVVPVSHHLDHPGPMARSVGDLRILYASLLSAGSEESLATWCHWHLASGVRVEGHDESATPHGQDARGTRPLRLGVVAQLYPSQTDESVRAVFDRVLSQLKTNGAEIAAVDLPGGFDDVLPMHRRIMGVEAAEYHRHNFAAHRDLYGPKIASLLDEGLAVAAVDYAAALRWQREYRSRVAEMFANIDALVMPSTDTTAPATLETTGTPKFQAPWSCAGVPAVSIPCGVAGDGMPVGLQIIGPHDGDWALLDIAAWCEERLAFKERPAMFAE